MFFETSIFSKIEEMGGTFWRCALKCFSQLWTNVGSVQKKQSLGSVANSWSYRAFLALFFLSEHGRKKSQIEYQNFSVGSAKVPPDCSELRNFAHEKSNNIAFGDADPHFFFVVVLFFMSSYLTKS